MMSVPFNEIPRLECCFFGVSLHIGTQLFAFVSMLSCLKAFLMLFGVSFFDHIDCVARAAVCRLLFLFFIVKVFLITVNAFLLFSIYTSKYFKFMTIWVWYTLVESVLTFVFGIAFQNVIPDPAWRFTALFAWNMYGCLVVYSYHLQLRKGGGKSGVSGI